MANKAAVGRSLLVQVQSCLLSTRMRSSFWFQRTFYLHPTISKPPMAANMMAVGKLKLCLVQDQTATKSCAPHPSSIFFVGYRSFRGRNHDTSTGRVNTVATWRPRLHRECIPTGHPSSFNPLPARYPCPCKCAHSQQGSNFPAGYDPGRASYPRSMTESEN